MPLFAAQAHTCTGELKTGQWGIEKLSGSMGSEKISSFVERNGY